jgi:hypothetical protein
MSLWVTWHYLGLLSKTCLLRLRCLYEELRTRGPCRHIKWWNHKDRRNGNAVGKWDVTYIGAKLKSSCFRYLYFFDKSDIILVCSVQNMFILNSDGCMSSWGLEILAGTGMLKAQGRNANIVVGKWEVTSRVLLLHTHGDCQKKIVLRWWLMWTAMRRTIYVSRFQIIH